MLRGSISDRQGRDAESRIIGCSNLRNTFFSGKQGEKIRLLVIKIDEVEQSPTK